MRLRLQIEVEADADTIAALPGWIDGHRVIGVTVPTEPLIYGVIVGAVPVESEALAGIVADRCEDFGGRVDFNPLGGASRGVGRCTCPCGKGTNPGCPVHP